MEAECTASGTANCAGLSVPNFMLRQEESSSYLTYTLLRSSGVPQSFVYPTQASGVISAAGRKFVVLMHVALEPRFKNIILFSSGGGPRADMC